MPLQGHFGRGWSVQASWPMEPRVGQQQHEALEILVMFSISATEEGSTPARARSQRMLSHSFWSALGGTASGASARSCPDTSQASEVR